jgi:geranylgeranyl diphosphate synthase type II
VPSGEAYLAECRALVTAEIRSIIRDGASDHGAYDLLLDYPLRHGKALRPALCIAVARSLGGALEDALPSAAVLEIYHNAFLIHDDIEDGSLERRGAPALHQTRGIPVAINCGDGLLALTLRPLLYNSERLGLGRALRILEIHAGMVTEAYEGQAQELRWIEEGAWDLSDADYEEMVIKKTCSYSFVAPARVGAAVAGASPEVEARFVPFFRSLGIAFQIQDDILNVVRRGDAYGKELAGDLWEGKRTLLLLHALRSAAATDRTRALAILGKPRPSPRTADFEALLDELRDEGDLDAGAHGAILRRLELRGGALKTADDVRFLATLLAHHGSVGYAGAVAKRHAEAAEAEWQGVSAALGDSVHARFLRWLKDYVVRREW